MDRKEFMEVLEFHENKYVKAKLEDSVKFLISGIKKRLDQKYPDALKEIDLDLDALLWHLEKNADYRYDMKGRLEYFRALERF